MKKRYGENALVIFTADHGEMLGNHGVWGKHDCAYDDVWPVSYTHLKIKDHESWRIATIWGIGYKFEVR